MACCCFGLSIAVIFEVLRRTRMSPIQARDDYLDDERLPMTSRCRRSTAGLSCACSAEVSPGQGRSIVCSAVGAGRCEPHRARWPNMENQAVQMAVAPFE